MEKLNTRINPLYDRLILAICLLLTFFSWWVSIFVNRNTQKSLFNFETQEIKDDLVSHVADHLDSLYSIRGLFDSSDSVTRDEFVTFVKNLNLGSKDQEFIRLSFVNAVPTPDISKFDKQLISEGYPDYKSNIVEGQEYQYIVNYITDSIGNEYDPTGINLWNGPERIEAIEYAIKNNRPSFSSVIKIRNVPANVSDGIIIIVPVYKDSKLIGLLNGIISTKHLANYFDKYLGNVGQIKLKDGESVVFDIVDHKSKKVKSKSFGNLFELDFYNKQNYSIEITKPQTNIFLLPVSNLVLISGLIISHLIYLVLYSAIRVNKKAQEMARIMTLDLNKYKLAIDNTDNHIVITDTEGKVTYANKAAVKMTGFSLPEIIGSTPALWGKQMPTEFYKRLWHTIKVERKIFSGEITNKRKNGEIYIAYASISPIIDGESNLIGFVGIEEDITADKKVTDELKKMNDLMVNRELKMIELKKQLEAKNKV